MQSMIFYQVFTDHDIQHGLILEHRTYYTDAGNGVGSMYFKYQILSYFWLDRHFRRVYLHTIDHTNFIQQDILCTLNGFRYILIDLFLQLVVLLKIPLDSTLQIFGIIKEILNGTEGIFKSIQQFFAMSAGLGFDTTDTCGYTYRYDR